MITKNAHWRLRNWPEYNRSLQQRDLWIDPCVIADWKESAKSGVRKTDSDTAISPAGAE